jgi:hypothetical protein
MTTFLTPFMVDGVFSAAFFAVNSCLASQQFTEIVKNYLCVLMREDLMAQHLLKTPVRPRVCPLLNPRHSPLTRCLLQNSTLTDSMFRAFERELVNPVSVAVAAIIRRVRVCSGGDVNTARQRVPTPVNSKVISLIRQAVSKQKLAQMPPQWMPWL